MPSVITVKNTLRRTLLPFRYRGLTVRDVLLASYPKSGSTWLRFLLFELLTGRSAQFELVYQTIPYVGRHHDVEPLLPGNGRLIKTHERYRGGAGRVIYLVRDARDVAVSEYRAALRGGQARWSFDGFLAAFLAGRSSVFGSWVDHVRYWLDPNRFDPSQMLVVRFEELRSRPESILGTILEFLHVEPVVSIPTALDHNSIERMREKEETAPGDMVRKVDPKMSFVGTGSVGGWKVRLTDSQAGMIERAARDVLEVLGYSTSRTGTEGAG